MKKLSVIAIIALLFSSLSAQTVVTPTSQEVGLTIKQSREVLLAKFMCVVEIPIREGISEATLVFGGGVASVLFIDGIAEQIDYHKGGAADLEFTPDEIEYLKNANCQGKKWVVSKTDLNLCFLEDGSVAIYHGKFAEWKHVISVISKEGGAFWAKLKKETEPKQIKI